MMESKAICVTDGSVKNWAEAVFIVFYRLFMQIFDCFHRLFVQIFIVFHRPFVQYSKKIVFL